MRWMAPACALVVVGAGASCGGAGEDPRAFGSDDGATLADATTATGVSVPDRASDVRFRYRQSFTDSSAVVTFVAPCRLQGGLATTSGFAGPRSVAADPPREPDVLRDLGVGFVAAQSSSWRSGSRRLWVAPQAVGDPGCRYLAEARLE